jgi:hypothetical protein
MSEGKQVFIAISGVMKELGAITKQKRNSQQGWNFRGIDDVYNAVNGLMAKHGIFTIPEVLELTREERKTQRGSMMYFVTAKVKYTIYASDGSYIESIICGEGMDTADKATSKALSIAHKYLFFQVFAIPTEEVKANDPDNFHLANGDSIQQVQRPQQPIARPQQPVARPQQPVARPQQNSMVPPEWAR